MLLGLWHPGVIRGDDEDAEIDRSNSGDHVVDEVGVTRNVYDT